MDIKKEETVSSSTVKPKPATDESDTVDSEDDYIEEEYYIAVEFTGYQEDSTILSETTKVCKLIGLDTAQPVAQIDDNVFRGHYEDVLGTQLFFRKNSPSGGLEYGWKTRRKLVFQRGVASKIASEEQDGNGDAVEHSVTGEVQGVTDDEQDDRGTDEDMTQSRDGHDEGDLSELNELNELND